MIRWDAEQGGQQRRVLVLVRQDGTSQVSSLLQQAWGERDGTKEKFSVSLEKKAVVPCKQPVTLVVWKTARTRARKAGLAIY